MNIRRIQTKLCVRKYIITFAYETKKGYHREQQVTLKQINEIDAASNFYS